MITKIIASVLALSSIVSSSQASNAPSDRLSSSAAKCTSYTIPLKNVTSENFIFNITEFKNDFDLTDFITNLIRKDSSTVFHPVVGVENVIAAYTISATFCTPKKPSGNGREKTVLLATHGVA